MIARRWHGRVPADKAKDYLEKMRTVGLVDYRSTSGNLGAWCLHRQEGEIVHFEMLTFWADEGAVRRFAGADMAKAKYYDFDSDFLIELEPEAQIYEVVER